VPCLTVRENTERPITVTLGTNQLVGRDLGKLGSAAE
jgi:UDP-N-acetylglucosamine 2-epimerase (non-hydrolysing)